MTGNVVFLGFAIAGARGLSISASLVALGSFLVGGLAGGRIANRFPAHRGKLLRAALATQLLAVGVAVSVAASGGDPIPSRRYALIALLAFAMGVQNATARRLAVPELTTTVLTMILTGIASDSTLAGGAGFQDWSRSLAVAAMFVGALIGALLAIKVDTAAALAAATGVLVVTAATAHRLAAIDAAWVRYRG